MSTPTVNQTGTGLSYRDINSSEYRLQTANSQAFTDSTSDREVILKTHVAELLCDMKG